MDSRKRKPPGSDGDAIHSATSDPGVNLATTASAPPRPTDHSPLEADGYFQNLYSSEPSFRQLAKKDPEFAPFLNEHGQLNFSDPSAVMQLTKTLLAKDFGLQIELPDDRLCPPVTNRHNYILWLKRLMDTTSYAPAGRKLCGLDVGTGASCIYPLLGATQRPWCFVATDIDAKSLGYAKRNVQLNGLESRIRVLDRKPEDALVPLGHVGVERIDFVMMNPPFYTSEDDMLSSAKDKARPPHSICTGAPVEMVCQGGEVAFVGRLLRESLVLRECVQWYTAMVGKATSLEALVEQLRGHKINNFAVTEFVQGSKTRRWALGWSFGPMRPAEDIARGIKASIWRKLLPPPSRVVMHALPVGQATSPLINRIIEVVGSLELVSWNWEGGKSKGVGRARENVWSRAWRRKKQRELAEGQFGGTGHVEGASEEECQLGFAITVEVGTHETTVSLHWVEGHDQAIFESFGGFLQGKLKDTGTTSQK
ncbi:hypothetical protein B0T18DRAFT_412668 [Schizothecium vesticola]|uniref:U6 small nuclear RNA (adenine-(43)-N(6))-methyltransferase n=1 Tax=Schizothecium vesticola TaxID=314040 RepID=A0AA40EWI8_9PEZI|nr:hypothetical protein B0T18DRAFT_412668 [Schizothecium vesticola]